MIERLTVAVAHRIVEDEVQRCHDAKPARLTVREESSLVRADQLQGAVDALASLRAAWDEHMKTCPQHANVPSFEQIDAWMKAPSNTASGPK